MIYAKVIADSVSPTGSRLTTIEAQFHRFILAEVNTHRAFSRNSASSRAIPTAKLIEQVRTNPAIPIEFGSNKPGMQAGEEVLNQVGSEGAWRSAAYWATARASELLSYGVHKQIVNRLLEPFMWHKAIITSTEAGWNNFFEQRISPLAQPEIDLLAQRIHEAMSLSQPLFQYYGHWHVPYITMRDVYDLELMGRPQDDERKVSAARCARVSYLTHDGKRDLAKDLELYDKLVSADPPHWSPLEHVATPDDRWDSIGNFDGWEQLRHLPEYQ